MRFLVLVLLVAACTSTSGSTTTTTVSVSPTTTTSTSTTSSTSTTTTTQPATPDPGDGQIAELPTGAVFDGTSLDRFRARTAILVSRDRDATDIVVASSIDAAFVREPAALEAVITADAESVSLIAVDGEYWLDQGNGFEPNPLAAQLLSVTSVTALAPETITEILDDLENLGSEEVEGRAATHYRGGIDDVEAWLSVAPEVGQFDTLEVGSIDVWIDDEAAFVVKAEYALGGVRANSTATEYYVATFTLYDFDGDFEVVSPS